MDPWLIVCIVLTFAMSFSIGANDASNGLATSYGSRTLTLMKLIFLGAVAEFVGAMFLSGEVATTLSDKIIVDFATIDFYKKQRMMFAILICSACFILLSSGFGMPISGTHTVVGAYIGAGVAATHQASMINWSQLILILISWVTSPLLAAIIAFILMISVASLILDTKSRSFNFRMQAI